MDGEGGEKVSAVLKTNANFLRVLLTLEKKMSTSFMMPLYKPPH